MALAGEIRIVGSVPRTKSLGPAASVTGWSNLRLTLRSIIFHDVFNSIIGTLAVANLALMSFQVTDIAMSHVKDETVNPVFEQWDFAFLVVFTIEILVVFFVLRLDILVHKSHVVDFFIIVVSWADVGMSYFGMILPSGNLWRVLRVARLSRIHRIMVKLPELHSMIKGFSSAVMSMFWGLLMIVLIIICFSILSVELLFDKHDQIAYGDDPWCEEVFTSVFKVFLMFFQNLVAGDSWGRCLLPVILAKPEMFFIFAGALVCVQLGFMNLILSSIVESAAKRSQEDEWILADAKRKEEEDDLNRLYDTIRNIDRDCSGEITIEEFFAGYDQDSNLRQIMSSLNIDRHDMQELFVLMDRDHSGSLSYDEFVRTVQRAETQDLRMQMMVMKLQLSNIFNTVQKELAQLVDCFGEAHAPPKANKSVRSTKERSNSVYSTAQNRDGLAEEQMTASKRVSIECDAGGGFSDGETVWLAREAERGLIDGLPCPLDILGQSLPRILASSPPQPEAPAVDGVRDSYCDSTHQGSLRISCERLERHTGGGSHDDKWASPNEEPRIAIGSAALSGALHPVSVGKSVIGVKD
eukprot:TRINITY_DN19826_c1_g2_i1.p1 TRINITY_DN19826_c1_g2~~TRINITY_DN19826_c1_g2_i1.p1  ORF type:complete len:581 (-),score=84.22 TRINITY_DN19826_c1_g2_i1:254-1996(-)